MSQAALWSGLDVTVDGGCWRITLQRPDRGNALSSSLVQALAAAVDEAYRAHPRCVVLAAAGGVTLGRRACDTMSVP